MCAFLTFIHPRVTSPLKKPFATPTNTEHNVKKKHNRTIFTHHHHHHHHQHHYYYHLSIHPSHIITTTNTITTTTRIPSFPTIHSLNHLTHLPSTSPSGVMDPRAGPEDPNSGPLHLHNRPALRGSSPKRHQPMDASYQVSPAS